MDLNNLILVFFLIVFSLLFYKYSPIFIKKNYPKFLIDDQLNKPQAFHESPTPILGGICIFFSLLIVFLALLFFENKTYYEYLSFCSLFFLLGFLDDAKINIYARTRLILMVILLIFLVNYNDFYLEKTGIEFLNNWIEGSNIFSIIFICLCFLFIINGANLIDGYNGLLGFHSLIILINLFLINYFKGNDDLTKLLFFAILIIIMFLLFNFPRAKIFLGDSGSYLLGAFLSISAIKTSMANPEISPFYFCILLFYLFFEVFFSFFRKIFKKKSPIQPDKKHIHMLLYKILLKKNNDKIKSNYHVSVIINLIYLILIVPAILMMENGMACKYYSLIFFVMYLFAYKVVNAKTS